MNYKNSELTSSLSILKMNLDQLASFLNIPKEKLELVSNISQELEDKLSRKSSPEEEKYENMVGDLQSTLWSFTHKHCDMPLDCILESLNHCYELTNGQSMTLIEMIKSEDLDIRYSTRRITVDAACFVYFKEANIGSRATPEKILNKRIAEEVLGLKVDAKMKWEYTEHGGDYEVPEVQVLTKVFEDGSGEWWEKLKNYSQDISAAWEIIDFLGKKGAQIRLSNKAMNNDYWWCYIDGEASQGSSAPEALCLAALSYVTKNKP